MRRPGVPHLADLPNRVGALKSAELQAPPQPDGQNLEGGWSLQAHCFPRKRVLGTHGPHSPDFSVVVMEGGVAAVVDEGLHLHFFAVFQNDVRELALCRAEDEQSQVPGRVARRWLRHKQPLGVPLKRQSPQSLRVQ